MLQFLLLLFVPTCFAQQTPTCGKKPAQIPWPDNYIVNGREAAPHTWPWQLSVEFNSPARGGFYHTCGGILLNSKWIITAAHCASRDVDDRRGDPKNFRIVAGMHDRVNRKGTEQTVYVEKIINHANFELNPIEGFPNDISLFKLIGSIDMTKPGVVEGCIPLKADMEFGGNRNCWLSGWGKVRFSDSDVPARLHEAKVPVWTYDQCLRKHWTGAKIRRTHICVGRGEVGEPNVCQGDSGGPLHCLAEDGSGIWYAAGIASWGVLGCEIAPGVYTNMARYWEWIAQNIETN